MADVNRPIFLGLSWLKKRRAGLARTDTLYVVFGAKPEIIKKKKKRVKITL